MIKRGKIISNQFVKSKLSQEVMGMSFGMIFSIILIIFFIVAAFTAIRYFLDMQKEVQLRTFFENFQNEIKDAYASAGIVGNENIFEASVPSGLKALCFSNSWATNSDPNCTSINTNIRPKPITNFAFYSTKYDKILKRAGYKTIENIDAQSLPSVTDCYCFPVDNKNKVKIKIKTTVDNSIVKIERVIP